MPLLLSLVAAAVAAPVPELRLAAACNLSGSMQSVDLPGYQGMKLAAEELNRGGRIKVTLYPVDGRSRPDRLANALRNLLARRKVDAVAGLYDSDYALAVGRVAQSSRIPFVSSGATLPDLTTRIGSYAFTACYSDDDQARAMAQFARSVLAVKTVSVLADPDASYTRTIARIFPEAFRQLGGRWLFTINDSDPGRRDKVKIGSDAVYAATLPDDAGLTVKRLRQSGFDGPILSGDGFDTPLLSRQAGISSFKVFFSTHVSYDNPSSRVKVFVKAFTNRFKGAPDSASAALGYDTVRLIASAYQNRAGRNLRDAIAATAEFAGVTGKISYPAGSREPIKSVSIVEQLGKDRVFRGEIEKP